MSKLKDCTLFADGVFQDGSPAFCLFGEVVEDARFEAGHRIRTSAVVDFREEDGVLVYTTESGTEYEVMNIIPFEEYKQFLIDKKVGSKLTGYLFVLGLLDED